MSERERIVQRLLLVLTLVVTVLVIDMFIDLWAGHRDVHHIRDLQQRVGQLEGERR